MLLTQCCTPDFGPRKGSIRILVPEKCRDFHSLLALKEKDYELTFCENNLQSINVVFKSICWTLFDNEAFLCCHQHTQHDHNNCHIKPPTNFFKNAKFLHWKSLKSKIFWFPLGKSDWLMNSKCLSNTVQHMWKWAIIPFFACLN